MNAPRPSQLRSRLTLALIAAMFLGSFVVAAVLRFSGWTPAHTRNYGELLEPPIALGSLTLQRADGTPYAWAPEQDRWRLLAVPAPGCAQTCLEALDFLHRTWLSQGRKADRLDVLWAGEIPANGASFRRLVQVRPDPALSAALPEAAGAESLPLYLVDPSGYLVVHYHPRPDPAGVRKDLGKLLK